LSPSGAGSPVSPLFPVTPVFTAFDPAVPADPVMFNATDAESIGVPILFRNDEDTARLAETDAAAIGLNGKFIFIRKAPE
jgi:hypothetical protein